MYAMFPLICALTWLCICQNNPHTGLLALLQPPHLRFCVYAKSTCVCSYGKRGYTQPSALCYSLHRGSTVSPLSVTCPVSSGPKPSFQPSLVQPICALCDLHLLMFENYCGFPKFRTVNFCNIYFHLHYPYCVQPPEIEEYVHAYAVLWVQGE